MNVRIPKFGTLIGLIKTSDEFEDGPSRTPLRALKTLTSKNLVNTINLQGLNTFNIWNADWSHEDLG